VGDRALRASPSGGTGLRLEPGERTPLARRGHRSATLWVRRRTWAPAPGDPRPRSLGLEGGARSHTLCESLLGPGGARSWRRAFGAPCAKLRRAARSALGQLGDRFPSVGRRDRARSLAGAWAGRPGSGCARAWRGDGRLQGAGDAPGGRASRADVVDVLAGSLGSGSPLRSPSKRLTGLPSSAPAPKAGCHAVGK
jgi:hypothetical protein